MKRPSLTIGIEEEFQVVDPETRQLRSHVHEVFAQGRKSSGVDVKPELHHPVVEVGTTVCPDVREAGRQIAVMRTGLSKLAREQGLRIAAAGTHPFSHWADVEITGGNPRYERLIQDLQMVARANLIFGLHVHIGVEDRDLQITIMNQARYFLPHVLALSVNSPFWLGMNTGLKSYRCKVFDKFPRTNIPDTFTSWADYENFVNLLVRTNCIDNAKRIWWDVRPHPFFSTLEIRICDIPMRVDETLAIAALIQATVAKLYKLHARNQAYREYSRSLLMENKWRASRYGIDGKLIDFGRETEKPAADLIREFIEWFLGDVLDELGTRKEVEYAFHILKHGSSADRQLATYRRTGDLRAVVDQLIEETAEGVLPARITTRTEERPIEFRPVSEVEIPISGPVDEPLTHVGPDVRD